MEPTLIAIYMALQIGPFVAMAIALPYTIYGYIKTKTVDVRKCTYFYMFVLYFLCAYFMTLLPLPSRESLEKMRPIHELIQLIPFKGFYDIKLESIVHDIAIILFNVTLTIPLGFALRDFFQCSLKKTLWIGFFVSLFYEVTQLTGLFFIYPRPWRIFDVDDLMINTLGTYIGYLLVKPILRYHHPKVNRKELHLMQGSEVAFLQRTIAAIIDFLVVSLLAYGLIVQLPGVYRVLTRGTILQRFPLFFVLFIGVAVVYAGVFGTKTIGYLVTGLRLLTTGSKPASRGQCIRRVILLYAGVFSLPFWVLFFLSIYTEYAGVQSVVWVFMGAVLMLFTARNVLEMMFNAVTHGSSMFYDRHVKTHLAYGYSKIRSVFGIRVLDIKALERENVDVLSKEICTSLSKEGIANEAITKVRLMAEGVLLDWMKAGLTDTLCELRMDQRFKRKALILSVPSENIIAHAMDDTYVEMLGKLNLHLETYYAGEKNICVIHIP